MAKKGATSMGRPSRLTQRLRGTEGFTLGEVLVTLLLVGLLTLAVAAGMGVALNVYNDIRGHSERQAVLNNAVAAVTDELRFAYDVKPLASDSAPVGTGTNVQAVAFSSTVRDARIYLGNDAASRSVAVYGVNPDDGAPAAADGTEGNPDADAPSGKSALLPLVDAGSPGGDSKASTTAYTAQLTYLAWNDTARTWTFSVQVLDGDGAATQVSLNNITVRTVNTW